MKQALNVHWRPVRSVQAAVVPGYLISSTYEGTEHLSFKFVQLADCLLLGGQRPRSKREQLRLATSQRCSYRYPKMDKLKYPVFGQN